MSKPAARALLLLFVMGLVGRVAFGALADRLGGLRTHFVTSALQTLLVFWFARLESAGALYGLAVVFGLGFSGVMTCIHICVRDMTPPKQHGYSIGLVTFFGWTGMGLGGYQGGLLFDLTGAYTLPFAVATLTGVFNLTILSALALRLRSAATQPVPAVSAVSGHGSVEEGQRIYS